MPITSTILRNDYTGNGSLDEYDFDFRIFTDSELLVTVRNTDDEETTLILNDDYTVDGAGDEDGGTITLTAGNLTTGYVLTIRANLSITQTTDFINSGGYFAGNHERALDKLTIIAQQLQEQIDRCLIASETGGAIDVGDVRMSNLSAPTDDNDAVRLVDLNNAQMEAGNLPDPTNLGDRAMLVVAGGQWTISDGNFEFDEITITTTLVLTGAAITAGTFSGGTHTTITINSGTINNTAIFGTISGTDAYFLGINLLTDLATAKAAVFTGIKQAASTSATGVVELGTSAEVATGTDTARVPPISAMGSHHTSTKAWAYGTVSGTTLTVAESLGCSLARISTGIYELTLTAAAATANWVAIWMASTPNTDGWTINIDSSFTQTTTKARCRVINTASGLADPAIITVSVNNKY